MTEFRVKTKNFKPLAKALRQAGEKDLARQLDKGVRRAARPLIPAARKSALARLPKGGGFAKRVAGSPMRTQIVRGRNKYGVRIVVVAGGGRGARRANRGVIRHPVFGNRDVWVSQPVPKDWFDAPMRQAGPAIRKDIERALGAVVEDIIRRGRR